jgi:hypothetical protein
MLVSGIVYDSGQLASVSGRAGHTSMCVGEGLSPRFSAHWPKCSHAPPSAASLRREGEDAMADSAVFAVSCDGSLC